MDNSLQACYGDRQTCLAHDLPGELDHLLGRVREIKRFLSGWLDVGQKVLTLTQLDSDSVDVEDSNP